MHTANRSFRRAAARLALLLLPLAGLTGCDAVLGTDSEEGIEGTWVHFNEVNPNLALYFEITSSTVTIADGDLNDCFYIVVYSLSSDAGDRYTLTHPDNSGTLILTFERDGENLKVTEEGVTFVLEPADVTVSGLEECVEPAGGGFDPSINCSALPAITLGQTINGELTTSDNQYNGRYFDLYGLTLTGQTAVQIDAASDPVDTYLYLYESDGTLITGNDDANDFTYNSRIQATLQAGCYRIEVTSWGDGETGTYTLDVN